MSVAVDQSDDNGFKLFKRFQRCRLQSYSHLDHGILELGRTNFSSSLKQACQVSTFHRSFSTPCLPLDAAASLFDEANPKIEIVGGYRAPRVRSLVVEVSMAIASGVDPLPVASGLGGAYLLRSQNGENLAVTKPVDEEPLALNNPKGFGGRMPGQPGIKSSVRVGETGIRELAAYLLDHDGFAGVPPSALVKISHVPFHLNNKAAAPYKIASLQRFIDHDHDAGELGPLGFSVASVHQIGILDVRLLNLDRHAGNILVKKHGELVPIDHGLCLPEWLDDPYFEWLHWPQASVPFSESEVEYTSSLDPFKDAELLRSEVPSLRESCIRVLVLCTIFLKRAVAAGLCLAAIGRMMSREFCKGEEKPSALENVCAQAKASIPSTDEKQGPSLFHIGSEEDHDQDQDQYFPVASVQDTPRQMNKLQRLSTSLSEGSIGSPLLSPMDPREPMSAEGLYGGSGGTGEGSKCSWSQNNNNEAWSVSFGDMSEENWELFLKNFESLLPEALERAKAAMSQRPRSRTSCKF